MNIKEIQNKETWENFLSARKEKTFLNSWNWGEFQKMMGNKIWRLGIYDGERLVSTVLVVKISAKRGTFLLIQHLLETEKENLKILLDRIIEMGKKEGAAFIRLAPLWQKNEENIKIFKQLGFRPSSMHASAYEATWKLDLAPTEDELLMNMRKTTRYLIRQAMKNQDILIEKSCNLKDIELYQKLNIEVGKKQNFVTFPFEYIKNEFEIFSKDNQALLFFGKYGGETAAAALVIFWQGIGFYHQAASDSKYAKFPVPYLLLWETIKEAKKRGCVLYDFWGFVDPEKNPKHPWAGPTLFKMGFAGSKKEYVKTQDLPLSKKYWLTFIFENIRAFRRFGFGRTLFSRFTRK